MKEVSDRIMSLGWVEIDRRCVILVKCALNGCGSECKCDLDMSDPVNPFLMHTMNRFALLLGVKDKKEIIKSFSKNLNISPLIVGNIFAVVEFYPELQRKALAAKVLDLELKVGELKGNNKWLILSFGFVIFILLIAEVIF